MSKLFSKGDVVTVRAKVKYDHSEGDVAADLGVCLDVEGHYQSVFVKPEHLTIVHRHFEVGERVWCSNTEDYAYVRAINDGFAWVQFEGARSYGTCTLGDLERAPLLESDAA